MYIPSTVPKDFWQKMTSGINNVRLMVKRVFITDDLGEEFMPRWLSFLKVTVDGESRIRRVMQRLIFSGRPTVRCYT